MLDKMRKSNVLLLIFLLLAMMMLTGCGSIGNLVNVSVSEKPENTSEATLTTPPQKEQTDEPNNTTANSEFEVQFIDCGQGDCILLRSGGETMLIDAANNKDGKAIVAYLQNQGVKKLDYVVGTHPDADHIGGLDVVIDTFDVGKVYLPKKQSTTKTFEDLLTSISNKGLKISSPKPGTEITLGSANLTILGPVNYYEDDNNNNSIVIRAVHGENSFMLTGDAGIQEEADLLETGVNMQATVLKVGHHGSNSSTSRDFIEAVKPTYAVISVGTGNKYGHPHKETLNYLDIYGVKVYRTDLEQTIIMKSDGKKLSISTGNSSAMGGSR